MAFYSLYLIRFKVVKNDLWINFNRSTQEVRPRPPKDPVGPFTERMVSALVEEKIGVYRGTRAKTKSAADKPEANAAPPVAGPSGSSGNRNRRQATGPFSVENEVIKALFGEERNKTTEKKMQELALKLNLVTPADIADANGDGDSGTANGGEDDPDDEILAELKRTQAFLRKLHGNNITTLRQLNVVARVSPITNVLKETT